MDRERATDEIKARWRELYPADGNGRGKGIICPLCGSGSGKNGTGITEKPNSKNHFLKCWHGGCAFDDGGSVIDLRMKETGETFKEAVDDLAAQLGIVIDPYRPTAAEDFSDMEERPAISLSGNSTVRNVAEPAAEPANYIKYYAQCLGRLGESLEAKVYLRRRGISLETADKYLIGFDPAWRSPTAIKRGGHPSASPRLIIPCNAAQYEARDIRQGLSEYENKFAKMNEGGKGIFNDAALYSDAAAVIVCEGPFDALSFLEIGKPAVAINSTSNKRSFLELMEQKPTKATLILCLDEDGSGKAATEELKQGLQRLNISYIVADICKAGEDPNDVLVSDRKRFEAETARVLSQLRPDNTALYLDNLMTADIERFKQAQDRLTGFPNLDEKAGGLYAGLYVLAAISSLGKTTFALQMADQMAAAGHEVLFFSMEQSRLEMVSKSLARITAQADMKTAVTSLSIRKGYLPSQVKDAAQTYRAQVGERLSIVEGNFNCDIGFISNYLRTYKQRTGVTPVVFIDYLQILQPSAEGKSKASKKDEIDLAVTELKRVSRELDATIIVISSLNRTNYMTPIAFESLKESGGIEYTADVVWGLQLACIDEDLFEKESGIKAKRKRINEAKSEDPRQIKFVCLKNRYGVSNFDCYFSYYPAVDLFIPAQNASAITFQRKRNKPI